MANTEKLSVIKMVREAKKVAQHTRHDTSLPVELRLKIEEVYIDLDTLEDELILGEIEDRVSSLEKASERLSNISADLQKETEKLQALSAKIERVAKGLAVLTDIAGKAIALV